MVYSDFVDYYALLEISFPATEQEIKTAYRKMARALHPDMHPDEVEFYTEKFKAITEAYETLSHPFKKGTYDLRYRQVVLQEFPEYEYYEDPTPADNTVYAHKYTKRGKRNFSYFPLAALLIFGFQFVKMILDAAPIEKPYKYEVSNNREFIPNTMNVPGKYQDPQKTGNFEQLLKTPIDTTPKVK